MWLRANIVLIVAVVFALVQMFASATGGPRLGSSNTVFDTVSQTITRSVQTVSAQDDNNEDNSDDGDNSDGDNGSEDNSDGDNGSEDNSDGDNGSEDNSDGDNDHDPNADQVIDNVAPADAALTPTATTATTAAAAPSTTADSAPSTTAAAPAASPAAPSALPAPSPSPAPAVREVTAVTNGTDMPLSLNDRVTVQLFSTLPAGLTVTLRMVDPLSYAATPGIRAGDLIFQIEAKDATGAAVTTLPAEANVTIRYTDMDVLGLTEANITLGKLDPATNQWATAPKVVTDPNSNFVAASITDLGVYAVYVQ